MWRMTFAAALALGVAAISNSANAQSAAIHIFESSYGLPGRAIPVTGLVAERCEGRFHCAFPVRNEFFGGDPVIGATKQVVVYWTCGPGRIRSAFPEYSHARLAC
jgi:hypothetical protein